MNRWEASVQFPLQFFSLAPEAPEFDPVSQEIICPNKSLEHEKTFLTYAILLGYKLGRKTVIRQASTFLVS